MPALETSSGTIEVLDWGSGPDQLFLLHASATGPATLAGLAKAVQRGRFHIFAPAFCGYGGTYGERDIEARPVTEINRAIANELLAAAAEGERIVFGHSMGGYVALMAALDAQAAGRPFDGLILYEPILLDMFDLDDPAQAAAYQWDRDAVAFLAEQVAAGSVEAGVSRFIEAWNETSWADLPAAVRQHLLSMAGTIVRETGALGREAIDRDRLRNLSTPTLLLRGDRSPAFTEHVSHNTLALLPDARVQVLQGCGHMAPILAPAMVAEAITAFCQAL